MIKKFLLYLLSKLDSKYEDLDLKLDRCDRVESENGEYIYDNIQLTDELNALKYEFKKLNDLYKNSLDRLSEVNLNGFARKADIVTLLYNIQSIANNVISKYGSYPDFKKIETNFMDYHTNSRAEMQSFKIMLKNYFITIQKNNARTIMETELYRTLSLGFNKLSAFEEATDSSFGKISKIMDVGFAIQDDLEFISKILKELPEIIKSLEKI